MILTSTREVGYKHAMMLGRINLIILSQKHDALDIQVTNEHYNTQLSRQVLGCPVT